ncbi:hypothetical protein A0J61_09706 [Choanephora cucurbitarum]|uniref:Uncharacterized protein n=1 Tax=Choanephora cucurbitarum TaxID=101091 RepID=A0A1C7N4K0_9FUNG|nr:hypothetical protein A0J61_09706 [Choanephora cucurbitarum]
MRHQKLAGAADSCVGTSSITPLPAPSEPSPLSGTSNMKAINYHVDDKNLTTNTAVEKYRCKAVAAAAEGAKMSDAYTLALNHIIYYDLKNHTINELGLSSHQDEIKASLGVDADLPMLDSRLSVVAFEVIQMMTRGSVDDVEILLAEKLIAAKKAKDKRMTCLVKLLTNYFNKVGQSLDTTEDTFVSQTIGPFLELYFDSMNATEHHASRGRLEQPGSFSSSSASTKRSYSSSSKSDLSTSWYTLQPDYLLKGLFENGLKIDVFLAEFKKPSAKPSQILNDKVKLGNLMKLMVDRLVFLGVPSPVVCGLFADGRMTYTYKMTIKKDGEYEFVELGCFGTIRCTSDLMSLPIMMAYFEQLAEIVKQTLEKMEIKLSGEVIPGPLALLPVPVEYLRCSYEYPSCVSLSSGSKKTNL